jgi:hypothetical protein
MKKRRHKSTPDEFVPAICSPDWARKTFRNLFTLLHLLPKTSRAKDVVPNRFDLILYGIVGATFFAFFALTPTGYALVGVLFFFVYFRRFFVSYRQSLGEKKLYEPYWNILFPAFNEENMLMPKPCFGFFLLIADTILTGLTCLVWPVIAICLIFLF